MNPPVAPASHSRSRSLTETYHILVVEDDRSHAFALETALTARGYSVTVATNGLAALKYVEAARPDVVLLDLGLPDIDGIEVCSRLRVWVRCPIVIVTADEDEARTVAALDDGADDYITKPYNMEVLLARLRVALRHSTVLAATVDEELLACGDVRVDIGAHSVRIAGTPVDLQARQFMLLTTLIRNADKLVPHANLVRVLWGARAGDTDLDRLRVVISTLRKHLGAGPRRPRIETVPALGYRLVSPR